MGRAGHEITVASLEKLSLTSSSRFCSEALSHPNPQSEEFLDWLLRTLKTGSYDFLIPVTDTLLASCYEVEEEIRDMVSFPFVDHDTFSVSSSKTKLRALALSLGILCPKTKTGPEVESSLDSFPYPAVLKPSDSFSGGKLKVAYPKSAAEAREIIANQDKGELLLQELVKGEGVGVFAYCENGEAKALFSHRRLLEKPPSGGVSVLSESLPLDQAPTDEALLLLERLNWQGLAMVEFKRASSGENYLLEINPRVWGSLQLAISSGVDFPQLLVEGAENYKPSGFRIIRLRWLLGSLDHLIISLKSSPLKTIKELFLKNSLRIGNLNTVFDVFRLKDVRPFIFELKKWLPI